MEDFENLGEQPEVVQPSLEENNTDSLGEEVEENKNAEGEAERGVPIGKFKNAQDLLKAYNNLQSEFTRKSQKLAEFESKQSLESEKTDSKENLLQSFLTQNPEATFYADELISRIESVQVPDEKAFKQAWMEILFDKLSSPSKAKEPIVQNLFLKDDEIQDMVIKNYMKQISQQKTPVVMSSSSGERVTKQVTQKPDTFEQAKKVVMDLLS